jgi:hypothetical protein
MEARSLSFKVSCIRSTEIRPNICNILRPIQAICDQWSVPLQIKYMYLITSLWHSKFSLKFISNVLKKWHNQVVYVIWMFNDYIRWKEF